jgi:hypothetical protein
VLYREAVGALGWAALATHSDITFILSTMARFAANPGPAHWEAIKRMYRYLAGTLDPWPCLRRPRVPSRATPSPTAV